MTKRPTEADLRRLLVCVLEKLEEVRAEAAELKRMVSAMPDLLVAAEAALYHLKRLEMRGILVNEAVIEALRSAIAKARGEG